MEFLVLGPLEVRVDGRLVDAGTPRQRAVLAALAADVGRPVPVETLVDRVWGADPPRTARHALYTYVTRIRRVLQEAAPATGDRPPAAVVRRSGGYVLEVPPDRVDLYRYRELVAASREPVVPAQRRREALQQAMRLWRGTPLSDLTGDWPTQVGRSWQAEHLATAVAWANAETYAGCAAAVTGPLTQLSEQHPMAENVTAALIRALHAGGRSADALEQYLRTKKLLVEELGVDPGSELQSLYQEILRGDQDVVTPRTTSTPAGGTVTVAPAVAAGAPAAAQREPEPRPEPRRPLRSMLAGLAVVVVVLSAVTVAGLVTGDTGGTQPAPLLAEEFSGVAVDASRWRVYQRDNDAIGSRWVPEMVRVENGALRIVGVGRNPTGKGNRSGGLCWCGRDSGRTYGTWKVRAKFDTGAGYGQVIGLWPVSDDPADGSITVAAAREADKRIARGFVLWRSDRQLSDERVISGDFTGWHTYTIQWRPGTLRMWVDDLVLYDSTLRGPDVVLPTKPMNLFIQQAIGPWEDVPAATASTPDEVALHVDWVHYWA